MNWTLGGEPTDFQLAGIRPGPYAASLHHCNVVPLHHVTISPSNCLWWSRPASLRHLLEFPLDGAWQSGHQTIGLGGIRFTPQEGFSFESCTHLRAKDEQL